jgi:light-regulated signal transduction histidine kinase (bacteriophytochrome)
LPRIKADKFRIQQLFQNLNAVNYIDKEQGLVEVANSRWRHIVCFFYKKDNGVGMPKEIHSKYLNLLSLYNKQTLNRFRLSIVKKL